MRKRRNLGVIFIFLVIIFLILYLFLRLFEYKLKPITMSIGQSVAQNIGTSAINDAVIEKLSSSELEYDSLVVLDKDGDGKVSALKTNIVRLNQIQSILANGIADKMQRIGEFNIPVPIGNIINGEIFSGKGPKINIKAIIPQGSVQTKIENKFTSAGINQTRHQIMLNVTYNVRVIMATRTVSNKITSSICLGETVIVGVVPESFTNVNGDDSSTIEKINNYTD